VENGKKKKQLKKRDQEKTPPRAWKGGENGKRESRSRLARKGVGGKNKRKGGTSGPGGAAAKNSLGLKKPKQGKKKQGTENTKTKEKKKERPGRRSWPGPGKRRLGVFRGRVPPLESRRGGTHQKRDAPSNKQKWVF